MRERIKLAGGPEKTVTWAWLDKGQLKVEFYDFSANAQKMFGNDVACTLTVSEMTKIFSLTRQSKVSLLTWLDQSFQSYFAIKRWLEEHAIGDIS